MTRNFYIVIFIFSVLVSCDSDEEETVDVELLFGKWVTISNDFCDELNYIEFEQEFNYNNIFTASEESCDPPQFDVYQSSGEFSISGNEIRFDKTQSAQVIISGFEETPPLDFFLRDIIYNKITLLTQDSLEIETKEKISIDNSIIIQKQKYTRL